MYKYIILYTYTFILIFTPKLIFCYFDIININYIVIPVSHDLYNNRIFYIMLCRYIII